MKPRLCIRTDGNSVMGLGHLMRCFALAQMVKSKFSVCFYCLEIPPTLAANIISAGFEFHKISSDDKFVESVNDEDLVILDGYQFTESFQVELKRVGVILICIDDLHDKHYFADLILNHAPGITSGNYSAEIYTQFALGSDYVLLRPGFLKAASETDVKHDNEIAFICFGGADPRNMTQQVLKIVSSRTQFKEINVVTGSAFTNAETIQSIADKDIRIKYFQSIDDDRMLALMQKSGIAIVPAGGILLECLAAGCNVISGLYVDNQKFIYSNYLQANTFTDAKDFSEVNIISAIKTAVSKPQVKRKFFDGKSGIRIEKILLNLAEAKKITLKVASIEDTDTTFKWANDPVIRKHSFSKAEIRKEEHVLWFERKIQSEDCIYLIALKDDISVGSIRFDLNEGDALISYLVDPLYHGYGYGQVLLCKGLVFLKNIADSRGYVLQTVSGKVFKENISSLKAFERTGFKIESETAEYITFTKQIAA